MTVDPGELHSLRSLSPVSRDVSSQAAGHGTHQYPSTYDDPNSPHLEGSSGKLRTRSGKRSWSLELLAWLVGAVTLAILIVALAVFNGKALGRWHSSVSVNTLVNVLTTIASTALIFPVASAIAQLGWLHLSEQQRPLSDLETFGSGPITIFTMIAKHPMRPLVYLGAANVILLLLFSPITQETVDLPIRHRNLTLNTGSIPRVLAYQADNLPQRTVAAVSNGEDTNDDSGAFSYQSVDRSMGTAIVSVLSGTPVSPSDITGDCQTGNCTFQAYSTMGICSKVEDVSSTIVKRCPRNTDDGFLPGCTYTVQELRDHTPWRQENLTTLFKGSQAYHSLWLGASDTREYDLPDPNTLVEFYAVYLTDTTVFDSDSEADFSDAVSALKGSLNLCVLSYQTQVVNGTTQTSELSRKTDLAWKIESKKVCEHGTSSCEVIATTDGGDEYWIDTFNKRAFNQYLGLEIFRGYSSAKLNVVNFDESGLIDTAPIVADLLVDKTKANGQIALGKMLDDLAVGMTNSMVTTAGQKDTAPGIASVPEIHIAVQFRWLAVPIASVILSFIFLLLVIFKTSRHGIPTWKMSSVAAILSIDRDTAQLIASQDHSAPLSSRAKALRLRLGQGDDLDWRLKSI
ncbi:MAG: hypothetical protein Q9220_005256 [cf. Caloplaca sp. 1 TL-2023]